MADKYCSVENVKFLLHEVHDLDSLLDSERFQDFDPESIDKKWMKSQPFIRTVKFWCTHR